MKQDLANENIYLEAEANAGLIILEEASIVISGTVGGRPIIGRNTDGTLKLGIIGGKPRRVRCD